MQYNDTMYNEGNMIKLFHFTNVEKEFLISLEFASWVPEKNNLFVPCVPWLFLFADVVGTGNCVVTVEEGNSFAAAGADVVNTVVVVVVIVADVVVVVPIQNELVAILVLHAAPMIV